MTTNHLDHFVDVGKLSEQRCKVKIQGCLAYASDNNLFGQTIPGYYSAASDVILMTREAAEKLCQAQNYLLNQYDYRLFVYDAYRPKQAVDFFYAWSKQPQSSEDLKRQAKYHPRVRKDQLFELGYIAEDSNHCYGHTVDLVLIDNQNNELNMGAFFDFMDKRSHIAATPEQLGEEVAEKSGVEAGRKFGKEACENRKILNTAMTTFDFEPLENEFWHFAYKGKNGRIFDSPFNFPINSKLRGIGIQR